MNNCFVYLLFLIAALTAQTVMAQCPGFDVTLTTQTEVNSFSTTYPGCTMFDANLYIQDDNDGTDDIVNLNGLSVLTQIDGGLDISSNANLSDISGLSNVTSIGALLGGDLLIFSNPLLTNIGGLSGLTSVAGTAYIVNSNVTSIAGLGSLTSVDNLFIQGNSALTTLSGLNSGLNIGSSLVVNNNTALTSLGAGNILSSVGLNVTITNNTSLTSLTGLGAITVVNGDLFVSGNGLTSLAGLSNLTNVTASFVIDESALTSVADLSNLTSIGGLFSISNTALANLTGLGALTSIGANFTIDNNDLLTNINALSALTTINGELMITNNAILSDISGMDNVTAISGNMSISGNPALSDCTNESICNYVENTSGTATISGNGGGSCLDLVTLVAECVAQAFPIQLVSFTARPHGSSVLLNWVTASEQNNEYFEIQHSGADGQFRTIAKVKGAGTTQVQTNYFQKHTQPLPGINYYRLKQTDTDGRFTYSPIASATMDNGSVYAYPNPTSGKLELRGDMLNTENPVEVRVLNAVGALVRTVQLNGNTLDLTGNAPGIYLLEFHNGQKTTTQRILID